MAPRVLYAGRTEQAEAWKDEITRAADAAGLEIDLHVDPASVPPETVDYLLYTPSGPVTDLSVYSKLTAILSLWAGVEEILMRPDLPRHIPLARMVEDGMTIGMTDFVVAHVMRRHVDIDGTLARHRARRWDLVHPPLSVNRTVGVMGLGALGREVIEKLRALNFQLRGWSRSPKDILGVETFAGLSALPAFLSEAEILVLLIPLTRETTGLLDATMLAHLPENAYIINVARGPILVEADVLSALDGRLGGATLDVFDIEPLPEDHPYWRHEKVTVTPHIASTTRPETASKEIVRQIARAEAGEPLHHLVDFARGY